MNYLRIYRKFIADRRFKEALVFSCEKHHIIPECLGGTNVSTNLIRLSYSDHFFAHLLLAKIHGGKLWLALDRMRGDYRFRGKKARLWYNKARVESIEYRRQLFKGIPTTGKAAKGHKKSKEHRAKIAAAHLGKKHPRWEGLSREERAAKMAPATLAAAAKKHSMKKGIT